MENANNSFTVVAPQEGPSISVVGDTYRIIICSEQTDGAYALIDMLIPPKGAFTSFACHFPRSILYNRRRDYGNNKEKKHTQLQKAHT